MTIRTRFLVLSDTHGEHLINTPGLQLPVDVVIHCGDFTEESKLSEVRDIITYLQTFNAPLKLIIAGNHEWTFDPSSYKAILARSEVSTELNLIKREFGSQGEARALFESEEARKAGVRFLDEGVHHFELTNGARLKVFASPYTACMGKGIFASESDWGFQYDSRTGHSWSISNNVDLVMTHGPPLGILDRTAEGRVGDKGLFAAIAHAQPHMHCFGHIHSEWGARRVKWQDHISDEPSYFVDINASRSSTIENLAGIEPRRHDSAEDIQTKRKKLEDYQRGGICSTGEPPRRDNEGNETLFINASIEGKDEYSQHLPWVVELDLSESDTRSSHCEEK